MLGQLPGDCLGAIFAEVERTGVPRVWPCAAGAVKTIRLVDRQQCSGASDLDALLAQRSGSSVQGAPATGGSVIGCKHRLADRLLVRLGLTGRRRRLIAHDRELRGGFIRVSATNSNAPDRAVRRRARSSLPSPCRA